MASPQTQLPDNTTDAPLRPGLKLFLLGFLTLFLELALIRYLAGSVWNLGYFPNLVLLATFVGMGTGFLLHRYVSKRLSPLVFVGSVVALLLLVLLARFAAPALPGFSQTGSEIAGEVYFTATPVDKTSGSYLMFGLWFCSVVLVFFCVSQRTAKLFRLFKPLTAYTLDISGALCGILSFMLLSWLETPPSVWFLLVIPVFLLSIERFPSPLHVAATLVLLSVAGLVWDQDLLLMSNPKAEGEFEVRWSPYQKVEYFKSTATVRHDIFVNGIAHQYMVPEDVIREGYYSSVHIHRRGTGLPPYRNVLVIGAGAGNDVAAALLNGAKHVDAVEIDPAIAELGRRHHPLRPYDDPRVSLIIDDGRAFMRRTSRRYDLVIFALTDSLVKVSAMAQLRLENYLFTKESVQRAVSLLTGSGDLFLYNYYRQPWLVEKYRRMCHAATGRWPRTIYKHADFEGLLLSRKAPRTSAKVSTARVDIPTDDWPFPYLQQQGMPSLYVKVLLVVAGVIVLFGFLLNRIERRRRDPSAGTVSLLTKIAFALMGLAFLLLETKSIVQFSLLFGTTWVNTSLVFLAILTLVLAANWVGALPKPPPLNVVFGLLAGSCLLALFYPLSNLLRLDSAVLRFILASLITFTPIFFANLLFSITFRDQVVPEQMFGWNLLGATLGGVLEYSSMALGYNTLAVIVAVCYTGTFALLVYARRLKSRRPAESAAPSPLEASRSPDDEDRSPAKAVDKEDEAEQATEPEAERAVEAARRPRVAGLSVLLFVALMGVYHLNGDFVPAADVIASNYLASSLFEEGNLSFTQEEMPFMFREFSERYMPDVPSPDRSGRSLSRQGEHYYLVPTVHKGIFVSTFGFGPTIAALPVFAVLRLAVGNLAHNPYALWYGAKFSASCFVAGSAVFVFLAAALFTRRRYAFLIAMAYGLGTCVWSISSQALWQHGPNEFFLAMGSYFLLRSRERDLFPFLCGLAYSCAVCCRPSSAVVVMIVGLFLLLTDRRATVLFIAGGLPLALALLGYNYYYFGSPFQTGQAIRGPAVAMAKTGLPGLWQTPLWKGAAGLLASPSRGLLVYSPFMVFALWGAVAVWRRDAKWAPLQTLSLAVVSMFIMQFKWFDWWGGHTYGYRPLVDGMPLLALFLVVVIDRIRAKPVLMGVFGVLLLWSVGVQIVGAFAYNEREWNTQRTEVRPVAKPNSLALAYGMPYTHRPANVDDPSFRHRLWSIRDSQILHHLRFFKPARRLKKTLMLARMAIAFLPQAPLVLQAACTPPESRSKDIDGVIDFGTAQAHEFLRSGWSPGDETVDGRTVRWAVGGVSTIGISLAPAPGDRLLTIVAKPMSAPKLVREQSPQRITVRLNGHRVGRITMVPFWRTYKLQIPKKVLRAGPNQIELGHDWCLQPSKVIFRSRDHRRLSVLYDELSLQALDQLPNQLESNLGTVDDRERLMLTGGRDDREQEGGRTFVRGPGPSPVFHFALDPHRKRYLLTLEARLDTAEDLQAATRVYLNGTDVGKIAVGRSWARRWLAIPSGHFLKGINALKLVPASISQPDTLFAKVAIRPLSAAHTIDFGTPAGREYLTFGWSHDEKYDKRTAVWSNGPRSEIELDLHPVAPSYALKVIARAFEATSPQEVAVSCNKQHMGSITFRSKWAERSLTIPRRVLVDGLNTMEFLYSKTVQPGIESQKVAIVVDRVQVTPTAQGK